MYGNLFLIHALSKNIVSHSSFNYIFYENAQWTPPFNLMSLRFPIIFPRSLWTRVDKHFPRRYSSTLPYLPHTFMCICVTKVSINQWDTIRDRLRPSQIYHSVCQYSNCSVFISIYITSMKRWRNFSGTGKKAM